ncbi:MAG: type VII secretion-associated serine protease mycosin, partial [Jatrophihabitans sp.]
YVQSVMCVSDSPGPPAVANGVSWAQRTLRYTQAWRFSKGNGIRVAVIDTGVNPGPAFGNRLVGLADLVQPNQTRTAGLTDCDGHGTLVAGIIGASVDPKSGFAGVAPEATIMSIRQSSENFQTKAQQNGNQSGSNEAPGAGTRESLAEAINYAVVRRAQVINISEADCQVAGNADLPALTDAVKHAVASGVVVVVAAGNLSGNGACKTQNTPGKLPVTEASPADIESPGLLTVGAISQDGAPASFSLAGSWVDVAAPGTDIIATNPQAAGAGQVDKVTTANGAGTIQGTSFAAPYVTGVVALIRARYPDLTPAQVVELIKRTAAHPAAPDGTNIYVGAGLIDPVAALTAPMPAATGEANNPLALPTIHLPTPSAHPQHVALAVSLGAVLLLLLLVVTTQTQRSRRRQHAASPRTR